jgi:hypothetical protein
MLDRVFASAARAVLFFIAYAALSPIKDRPTIASSSVLEHLAAFAAMKRRSA